MIRLGWREGNIVLELARTLGRILGHVCHGAESVATASFSMVELNVNVKANVVSAHQANSVNR